MKKHTPMSRKLRYGGTSAALTALIIAAVILVNVIVTVLGQKNLWYTDLTPSELFTLSDAAISLLENGDETYGNSSPLRALDATRAENAAYNKEHGLKQGDAGAKDEKTMINLIFCDDPDAWDQENTLRQYIYQTAKQLRAEFPDYFTVSNYNIIREPSLVDPYRVNALSVIHTTDVIISCGSEFRIYSAEDFYYTDTDEVTGQEIAFGYRGERKFVSSILAVTRASSPVVCLIGGHGETYASATDFIHVLDETGFELREVDLTKDEIPENCRLAIIYNPANDFMDGADGVSEIDEIGKLDKFLAGGNSLMVFMDPQTKPLTHLEDYLEEWGIAFDRTVSGGVSTSHVVEEASNRVLANQDPRTFYADYVLGTPVSYLTEDIRSRGSEPRMVFKNAMSISYADGYEVRHYPSANEAAADDAIPYDYGITTVNGHAREIYDIFVSSPNAKAVAAGEVKEKATAATPLKLMTCSRQIAFTQEDNLGWESAEEFSHVYACGSIEFAADALLQSSAYGNNEFLLSVAAAAARESVPHSLTWKPIADLSIDTMTSAVATRYTLILTIVPAVLALGAGIFILVRRKYR